MAGRSGSAGRDQAGRAMRRARSEVLCRIGAIGFCFVTVSAVCFAAQVVLVMGSEPGPEDGQVVKVAEFMGLDPASIESAEATLSSRTGKANSGPAVAVLVSYQALSRLHGTTALGSILAAHPKSPVLIFGVTGESSPPIGSRSPVDAMRCVGQLDGRLPESLDIADSSLLAGPLRGSSLPAVAAPACTMTFEPGASSEVVLAARYHDRSVPVLVRTHFQGTEVFFAPQMNLIDRSWIGKPAVAPQAFSSVAPFIIFLSYAAGDRAWHLDGHYANLTIDDAWLTQPFGKLDYLGLLREMKQHGFHTTLAFVPWNFDRSHQSLVTLFQSQPDYFSICLHGNDHKHREFGEYRVNPLQQQTADVKQGIARMERFHTLTGLPYDRFMVFPHGVAPQETFAVLRRYDFLGTANSQNVPLGTPFPSDPLFVLRTYTTAYGGLLSLYRYAAMPEVSRLNIAIDAFLGNPLLFYSHENLFAGGIGAFNSQAEAVNEIQPTTQWKGLGYISRHLYLTRSRGETAADVRMLTNEMELTNQSGAERDFYGEYDNTSGAPIRSVTVDGRPLSVTRVVTRVNDKLRFHVSIPGHESRMVLIRYENDMDVLHERTAKGSLYVACLRWTSDFRDVYLSRSAVGRHVMDVYYRHGGVALETGLEQYWPVVVVGIGVVFVLRRYRRQLRTER